jgi:2-methylisocitrate lyase-like PEP mutase family enzyme
VRTLIDAGAAGINLDDGGYGDQAGEVVEPQVLVERLREARGAAERAGVPLFLIARTELFWRKIGDEQERAAAAARRGAPTSTRAPTGPSCPASSSRPPSASWRARPTDGST